jgi:hypothetical protein
MIHGLVNTNHQNHVYYGKSPLCPICHQEEETLRHVFSCPSVEVVHHRQNSLVDLKKTLTSISTPQPVIDAIVHGFTSWCQDPNHQHIWALMASSLWGPDAVLASAFHGQHREIRWYHFCLGHISQQGGLSGDTVQFHSPSGCRSSMVFLIDCCLMEIFSLPVEIQEWGSPWSNGWWLGATSAISTTRKDCSALHSLWGKPLHCFA